MIEELPKDDLVDGLYSLCEECWNWSNSLYLLLCVKIGPSTTPDAKYFSNIQYLLDSKYSLGILGGKPKRALYFVGY